VAAHPVRRTRWGRAAGPRAAPHGQGPVVVDARKRHRRVRPHVSARVPDLQNPGDAVKKDRRSSSRCWRSIRYTIDRAAATGWPKDDVQEVAKKKTAT